MSQSIESAFLVSGQPREDVLPRTLNTYHIGEQMPLGLVEDGLFDLVTEDVERTSESLIRESLDAFRFRRAVVSRYSEPPPNDPGLSSKSNFGPYCSVRELRTDRFGVFGIRERILSQAVSKQAAE
jgi:hypothetical protein